MNQLVVCQVKPVNPEEHEYYPRKIYSEYHGKQQKSEHFSFVWIVSRHNQREKSQHALPAGAVPIYNGSPIPIPYRNRNY